MIENHENDEFFDLTEAAVAEPDSESKMVSLGSEGGTRLTEPQAQAVLNTFASDGWKYLKNMFERDRETKAFSFLTEQASESINRLEQLGIVEGAVGYADAMIELPAMLKQDFEETFRNAKVILDIEKDK